MEVKTMLYRTEDLNTFAGIGSSKGVYCQLPLP